jgi:hypothetical protein
MIVIRVFVWEGRTGAFPDDERTCSGPQKSAAPSFGIESPDLFHRRLHAGVTGA